MTNFSTEKQPRGIKIDPSGTYLVAAGEKSDRLAVCKIDRRSGRLTEINRYSIGNGPNWIEFVDTPQQDCWVTRLLAPTRLFIRASVPRRMAEGNST